MEISIIGSSQAKIVRIGFGCRDLRAYNPTSHFYKSKICFNRIVRRTAGIRIGSIARSQLVTPDKVLEKKSGLDKGFNPLNNGVRLYVGLPMDAVSDSNAINHTRAIGEGLKALKLLGVDGVELPVWWGIAEKEAMGNYEWSAYFSLVELVQKAGLKIHMSLCFHASKDPKIILPKWVSQIGEENPSIFFTDRSGQKYKDCLSLAVDNLPLLNGKTPIQIYREFCEDFKSTFSDFMGFTITGISMGLGPEGELRYPSFHRANKNSNGAGEFQCYDANMLHLLKQHAEASQNPLWGLGGPHDVPSYDQLPNINNFFKDNGGSWETPYGNFFLSWYSAQLIAHGDRILSLASTTFKDSNVRISGKVPLAYSWYKTKSHPSELTTGFYNTNFQDGYENVADMFSRNSCRMIIPGMDLVDVNNPRVSMSSPELLVSQIKRACRKYGVEVSGQNSRVSGDPRGFWQIKKNLFEENKVVDLFTYQRMGAFFFSPKHFPLFTDLMRCLSQQGMLTDDLHIEEAAESVC